MVVSRPYIRQEYLFFTFKKNKYNIYNKTIPKGLDNNSVVLGKDSAFLTIFILELSVSIAVESVPVSILK